MTSVVDLAQLTSPDFPAPADLAYTTEGDIDVKRESLEKLLTQYREQRSYHSDDKATSRHRISERQFEPPQEGATGPSHPVGMEHNWVHREWRGGEGAQMWRQDT